MWFALLATLCTAMPQDSAPDSGRSQLRGPLTPIPGSYHAWLDCPGGAIDFGLEIAAGEEPGTWQGWLINGPERDPIGAVTMDGNTLVLRFDPYDSTIRATYSKGGRSLKGEWLRPVGGGKVNRLPFHAKPGARPLWQPTDANAGKELRRPAAFPAPRYRVQFSADKHHAVGLFSMDPENFSQRIDGTFLTTLGDYRYLQGIVAGDRFSLSCFDGAHAFLFKAQIHGDGTLTGDFWSRDAWHETWTAVPDPEVALPDPFGLTRFVGGVPLGELAFPDLTGKTRSLADPAFAGRARLLVLLGTWCPNCNDQTDYLVELHERYADKGLSIVGLAFEFGEDFERNAKVVKAYAEHHGARFPFLIAGPHDKSVAAKRFPVLDKVLAYPTTLFLDAQGNVQAVYTGFSGPATGEHHQKLRAAFERRIDELLKGAPPKSR